MCVLDAKGKVLKQESIANNRGSLTALSRRHPGALMVMEVGTHSPWTSRFLEGPRAKRKAVVAVARNLAVLLLTLEACILCFLCGAAAPHPAELRSARPPMGSPLPSPRGAGGDSRIKLSTPTQRTTTPSGIRVEVNFNFRLTAFSWKTLHPTAGNAPV